MCEYAGTSKPNKKTLYECQLCVTVCACVCVSLCFNSAILSLITLWQRLYICGGVFFLGRGGGAGGVVQVKRKERAEEKERGRLGWGGGFGGELLSLSQPVLLSMLDAPDGLDLGGLTVGAPVPPVLVVPAVSLTLHDVLLAPVARVLVAHEAVGGGQRRQQALTGPRLLEVLDLCLWDSQ